MLLLELMKLLSCWRPVFCQRRSTNRAVRQAIGSLVCLGRRTLSRIIWTNGGENRPWVADYLLHSRSAWNAQKLFDPIIAGALRYNRGEVIGIAIDDTRLRKTGKKIPHACYGRDPMSPPFHINLMYGLRFLQASFLVPLHRTFGCGCRALPVRFQEAPTVKRPSAKADAASWKNFKLAIKENNLSRKALDMMRSLRESLDRAGATAKIAIFAGDGSFCNRTIFSQIIGRCELIVRTRRNAKLCLRATGSKRFYDSRKFTPESIRQDETIKWCTTKIFYGGKRRKIRFKEVPLVFWEGGARRRPLRLLVLAPTAYKKQKNGRLYYRQPAYLLTTVLSGKTSRLLQIYFDRWQIEVNHRDEKDTLGVGQAQMHSVNSVPRQPALVVAAYSALLLASINAFGPARGNQFLPLPRWRKHAHRPSCLDLITLLRKELVENTDSSMPLDLIASYKQMINSAAA
jgi:hypothetical protein